MPTASRKIRPVTWQGALSAGMHLLALHKRCAVVHEQKGGSSGKANRAGPLPRHQRMGTVRQHP